MRPKDHVERLARQVALRELLDTWDREGGPVPESEQAAARAAFDQLDGLTDGRRTATSRWRAANSSWGRAFQLVS